MMPPELIEIVSKGGMAALPLLLLFLWWRADTERREVQKKFEIMAERAIAAMTEFNNALETIEKMFGDRKSP